MQHDAVQLGQCAEVEVLQDGPDLLLEAGGEGLGLEVPGLQIKLLSHVLAGQVKSEQE
jgi:hypothetical protein